MSDMHNQMFSQAQFALVQVAHWTPYKCIYIFFNNEELIIYCNDE